MLGCPEPVSQYKKCYQRFKISKYLRGWINYFGIASGYQHCVELDHWIRRRVRMAYWRQ
ncbi:MAG: group II intron maturase-specific domain-containing protein [Pseudomonas sp.]|nr:group II intron maturase-specific domain-containing protein [Pseudomonas sp.]